MAEFIGIHGGRKVYRGGLSGQAYYADNNQPVPAFALIETLHEDSVSDPGVLKQFDAPSRDAMSRSIAEQIEGKPMDTVRSTYRELTDAEKADLLGLKTAGQNLIDYINSLRSHGKGTQRELALALTKSEEAVMWATKGLTG